MDDDDAVEVTVDWFKNVYRIPVIGDGSCFIHAFLKASDPEYQENNSLSYRKLAAKNIRKDLATYLALPTQEEATKDDIDRREKLQYLTKITNPLTGKTFNNDYKYLINYETVLDGGFLSLFEQQSLLTEEEKEDEEIDYSPRGLQKLFNSREWLGDETYAYIGNILGLIVYILLDDLSYLRDTKMSDDDRRRAIVIIGDGAHYEVIAIKTKKGYQTIFSQDDKFLKALDKQKLVK
jgi:hypothetical protein